MLPCDFETNNVYLQYLTNQVKLIKYSVLSCSLSAALTYRSIDNMFDDMSKTLDLMRVAMMMTLAMIMMMRVAMMMMMMSVRRMMMMSVRRMMMMSVRRMMMMMMMKEST